MRFQQDGRIMEVQTQDPSYIAQYKPFSPSPFTLESAIVVG
ncbi:hypothetical protein LINGRAHAP2_LOCUS15057 [Linum grandiflorum]